VAPNRPQRFSGDLSKENILPRLYRRTLIRLTFGFSRGGVGSARAAVGCMPVLDGVLERRDHFLEIWRQSAAALDCRPQRHRRSQQGVD